MRSVDGGADGIGSAVEARHVALSRDAEALATLRRLTVMIDDHTAAIASLARSIEAMEHKLEQQKHNINQATSTLSTSLKSVDARATAVDEQLESHKREINEHLESLNSGFENVNDMLASKDKALSIALDAALSRAEKKLTQDLGERIEGVRARLEGDLQSNKSAVSVELDRILEKIDITSEKLDHAFASLDQDRAAIDAECAKRSVLEGTVHELVERCGEIGDYCEELQQSVSADTARVETRLESSVKVKITEFENWIKMKTSELEKIMRSSEKSLKSRIEELTSGFEERLREAAAADTTCAENLRQEFQAAAAAAEAQSARLQTAAEAQSARLQAAQTEAKREIDAWRQEIDAWHRELDAWRGATDKDLCSVRAKMDALPSEMRTEIDGCKSQVQVLSADISAETCARVKEQKAFLEHLEVALKERYQGSTALQMSLKEEKDKWQLISEAFNVSLTREREERQADNRNLCSMIESMIALDIAPLRGIGDKVHELTADLSAEAKARAREVKAIKEEQQAVDERVNVCQQRLLMFKDQWLEREQLWQNAIPPTSPEHRANHAGYSPTLGLCSPAGRRSGAIMASRLD